MASMLFTNVRILDGTGAPPYAGEVLVQGNRIARVGRGTRLAPDRRRHRDRRRGRHADARAWSRPTRTSPGTTRPTLDDIQRMPLEEHVLWSADVAQALPRGGLHLLRGRGLRQAAARRGDAQRHQRGPDPRPALPRGQPGDHRGRRARRRDAAAPAVSRVQLRRRGQRARGDAQGRAHVPQVRRRLDQAQPVGRQLRRQRAGGHDLDERRGGRDRRARGQDARQARRRATRAPANRSSSACATASRSSTTRASPTRKRSTCWRPRKDQHLRRARHRHPRSPCSTTRRPGASTARRRSRWATRSSSAAAVESLQEDAQARHPRAARRRLRLRLDAARRRTPATSSTSSSTSASRRWRRIVSATKLRRRDHDAGRRARPDQGRLSRRPAAGRRRPARQPRASCATRRKILAIMKDGAFHKEPEIAQRRRSRWALLGRPEAPAR